MIQGVTWPLKINVIRGGSLGNTFGKVRKYANGQPKPHQGWDFKAAIGTDAYAIADGTVEFVVNKGDYGRQMCMSFNFNGQKLYAFYAHMQDIYVNTGNLVKGQLIGKTGKSGNASKLPISEEHLHFEIRTQASCGLGLKGRVSPIKIYGTCPLNKPVIVP